MIFPDFQPKIMILGTPWRPKGGLKTSILTTCSAQKSTFVYTGEWGKRSGTEQTETEVDFRLRLLRFPIFHRKLNQHWSKIMRLRLHLGRLNPILTDSDWISETSGDFIGEFLNDLNKDVHWILASISG